MTTLPTPNQLISELIGETDNQYISKGFGVSRVIDSCMDTPVCAYGIGMNCIVFLVKSPKSNLLKAYCYGDARPFGSYRKEVQRVELARRNENNKHKPVRYKERDC